MARQQAIITLGAVEAVEASTAASLGRGLCW
jgi:hypothetical protein